MMNLRIVIKIEMVIVGIRVSGVELDIDACSIFLGHDVVVIMKI
jgi:hypothetical protein